MEFGFRFIGTDTRKEIGTVVQPLLDMRKESLKELQLSRACYQQAEKQAQIAIVAGCATGSTSLMSMLDFFSTKTVLSGSQHQLAAKGIGLIGLSVVAIYAFRYAWDMQQNMDKFRCLAGKWNHQYNSSEGTLTYPFYWSSDVVAEEFKSLVVLHEKEQKKLLLETKQVAPELQRKVRKEYSPWKGDDEDLWRFIYWLPPKL